MREELEEIGMQLRKWARKYEKDYVSVCLVDDTIMANIDHTDKDYEETHIYID